MATRKRGNTTDYAGNFKLIRGGNYRVTWKTTKITLQYTHAKPHAPRIIYSGMNFEEKRKLLLVNIFKKANSNPIMKI